MRTPLDRSADQQTVLKPPTCDVEPPAANRSDRWLALVVGLAAFALYLRTLAPGLFWGDPGEFQFAAWLGGFAHPTGYPLYLLLGWLWTHLIPWGDPAWRMNLFSAAWGATAVGLVYLVATRALRSLVRTGDQPGASSILRLSALCAAVTFAVTPTFWSQAVVAEVYTLHAAFVAALLLALLSRAERPRALYGLALLYGFSLAHHRTTLLLLPALAAFLWLSRKWTGTAHALPPAIGRRTTLIVLVLLAAPLLLYLYVPLRAPQVPYFQLTLEPDRTLSLYRTSVAGFLEHISGSGFGAALGGGGDLGRALPALGRRFIGELGWPGIVLGLIGVGRLAWLAAKARLAAQRSSVALLALTVTAFLATLGFNLSYGIGDIFVFYIPAYLIWSLWIGVGVWAVGQVLVGRRRRGPLQQRRLAAHALVGLLALMLPAFLLLGSWEANDRSKDDTARAAWEAILSQPIPQGAILISNDRDEMVPQWYLKYVEGRRPDLDGLFPLIQSGPAWSDVARVAEQALSSGRPVLLVKPMPGLEVKFALELPTEPAGQLVRVLGPADRGERMRASGATFGEQLRLSGYETQPAVVGAGRELVVVLYWDVLATPDQDYTTFVHLINDAGAVVGQSDQRPGGVYYPTSLWRPGERLRDAHRIDVAAAPGEGPFVLEVGVYRLAPDLQHLGTPQRLGTLEAGG